MKIVAIDVNSSVTSLRDMMKVPVVHLGGISLLLKLLLFLSTKEMIDKGLGGDKTIHASSRQGS